MSSNNGGSDQSALLYKAADLARKHQLGLVLSIDEVQKLEESCHTLITVAGEGLLQFVRQSERALNASAPDAKPDPPASKRASKKKTRKKTKKASKRKTRCRSSAGGKVTKKKARKKTGKKKARSRINKRTKLENVPDLDKRAVSYLMNTKDCKTVGDVVRLDQEKVWQRAVPVVVKLRALTTKSR